MNKATAVELAHQIQELLKTRDAIRKLEYGVKEVIISGDTEITIMTGLGLFETVTIPPHVMRLLVDGGSLLKACKLLERNHERTLADIAGIIVERERP